ncbi:restriction endonuclease subunit S domain-containing protein [Wenzhouxiangella sp. EGI_FJ10409]|uniref:hypothetical protein n=1 Tax=Wenzhouxiangella sp. EGI_FJ10409 TaxID=3243767 RepID=UPI0035D83118
MKDSGVEWLGEVPAQWNVKRLKHISPQISVGLVINPSIYVQEEGVPFLFGGNIVEGGFKLNGVRRMSDADSRKLHQSRLRKGDLVCVRVGYPGVTAVVPAELDGANCASVMVIRSGPFESDWLCHALNSRVGRFQVGQVQYGAAQKQFNIGDAIEWTFPVPPQTEQKEIVKMLTDVLGRLQAATEAANRMIGLLRERRSALISAAVTGKIDVRDWKPPEQEDAAS